MMTTAGTDSSWVRARGHSPAESGIWPSAANSTPKPRPASRPSTTPAAVADRCPGSWCAPSSGTGSRETSQIPGRATAMPTHASRAGRSPETTPTSSGTTAAPTADTGATTPIRPAAKPR